jgi:hypothetical protein
MVNITPEGNNRVCALLDSRWNISSIRYDIDVLTDQTNQWISQIIEISDNELSQLQDTSTDYTGIFWSLNKKIR